MRVCIVGASGKLGKYMVEHALDRRYAVVRVCRAQSVGTLDADRGRIEIVPGATNDPDVIRRAVAGCDGVLAVLVPWGVDHYASGTAQAVLDHAPPRARLIFSCGWHISRDGSDVYSRRFRWKVHAMGWVAPALASSTSPTRWSRLVACSRATAAGPSSGPASSRKARAKDFRCGAARWAIRSWKAMRRIDFALFMIQALTNDDLVHEAPAIVGAQTASAFADVATDGKPLPAATGARAR